MLARQGIESILSPKQQRRPLSFFFGSLTVIGLAMGQLCLRNNLSGHTLGEEVLLVAEVVLRLIRIRVRLEDQLVAQPRVQITAGVLLDNAALF